MEGGGLDLRHRTATCAKVLSMTQYFMREQKASSYSAVHPKSCKSRI